MQKQTVLLTTHVGTNGKHHVDLPLDLGSLNERLFEIGLWLIEQGLPHQARILTEPQHSRLRVSFTESDDARAFRERFGARLN